MFSRLMFSGMSSQSTMPLTQYSHRGITFDNASVAAGMVEEPKVLLERLNKLLEVCVYQGAGYNYSTSEYTNKDVDSKFSET